MYSRMKCNVMQRSSVCVVRAMCTEIIYSPQRAQFACTGHCFVGHVRIEPVVKVQSSMGHCYVGHVRIEPIVNVQSRNAVWRVSCVGVSHAPRKQVNG